MFHHENQSYTIIFSTSNFKMRVPYVNNKQLDDYRPLNVNTEYFTIKSTSFGRLECISIKWRQTNVKVITAANQGKGKYPKGPKKTISKTQTAWSAGKREWQIVIDFSCETDWLIKWREFSGPIIPQSNAKWSWITSKLDRNTIFSQLIMLNSRWGETLWIGGLGSSFSWVTVLYFYFHETSHRSESSWLPATVRHTWQLTRGEEGSRAMDWYSSVCEWGGGEGKGSVCEGRRRIAISPTASNIPLLAEEFGRLPLTSKSYSLEVK